MNQDGQPNLCTGLPVCQFPDRVCPWKAVDLQSNDQNLWMALGEVT